MLLPSASRRDRPEKSASKWNARFTVSTTVQSRVPVSQVRDAVGSVEGTLFGGGLITLEPGGQLEISSACAAGVPEVISSTREDLAQVDRLLAEAGLRLGDLALDPVRRPVRTLDLPRYAAMEQRFDRAGPAGRTMMCSTASLQISLDAGTDGDGPAGAIQRWHHLYSLAPLLTAMFANSPFIRGKPSGWRSTRQSAWLAIDPSRTAAPEPLGDDPRQDWARYALDAHVLCIRPENDGGNWLAPRALTMRDWLRGAGPRPVSLQDLDYHLTTLFPPVRPRGFLELRLIDAQAGGDWEVATVVVAALVEDPHAAALAAEACRTIPTDAGSLLTAARDCLACPELARAALICAEVAWDALPRIEADTETRARAAAFIEKHTARGLSPADVSLAEWQRTGRIPTFTTDNAADYREERLHEHR
ncbi:glutamate-cysteine ligase family protein [Arthrobacter sp. CG_A4]|uniref:glutamate-cysteine ligase family protein n=1 Tax=Arthrobacter sp. CG_A4 TaxID=3071706 RepID=UPI002E007B77|nr:glutamate--cysteine ligase [Arthrobacter sp. CG_A4]